MGNLILKDSYIPDPLRSEDLKTLEVTEVVGFSTENGDSRFNNPSGIFEDLAGNDYPKIDDVTIFLLAFQNKYPENNEDYQKTELSVTRQNYTSSIRTLTQVTYDEDGFEYSDISYKWLVEYLEDGWVDLVFVPVYNDAVGEDYYYDTAQGLIIKSSDNSTVSLSEVYKLIPGYNVYRLPLVEKTINVYNKQVQKKQNELILNDCRFTDEYYKYDNHCRIIDTLLSSAINFFEIGSTFEFQRLIEKVWSYINDNNLNE